MNIAGENRPLRVLELRSTYRWGGGPDKTVLNSAKMHNPGRIWTLVVYLRSDWDTEFSIGKKARDMGLNYEELVEHGAIDLNVFKKIIELVKQNKIDIVHSRDYKTNLYALIIKKFFCKNVKIVTTAHGWVGKGFKLSLYYTLDKMLVASFDRNFILFKDQVRLFLRKPKPEKTIVIHNAIDPVNWSRVGIRKECLRRDYKISESSKIIGYVGRIMPEKDIVTMVRVAHELINKKNRDVYFVLVGESKDTAYDKLIKYEIDHLNLNGRIIFTGKRNDLKEVFIDFDVFLMTSIQEGFPNSLLEAMAMEVPSVVTSVDGIPEIVKNKVSGLLVNIKDASGIADDIDILLGNDKLRELIVRNARLLVENELSFERRLRKMEDEYERIIKR